MASATQGLQVVYIIPSTVLVRFDVIAFQATGLPALPTAMSITLECLPPQRLPFSDRHFAVAVVAAHETICLRSSA